TAKFNDVKLIANPGDSSEDIVEFFDSELDRLRNEWVNSPEYAKQQDELKQRKAKEEIVLRNELLNAPEHMTIQNQEAWQKFVDSNYDDYGRATIEYAELWARLMESRINLGSDIEQFADKTSHIADSKYGITGFMYGC